jgi:hypothetical protein
VKREEKGKNGEKRWFWQSFLVSTHSSGQLKRGERTVGDLLQVSQVSREEGGAEALEVGVLRVVDLDDSPRVTTGADELSANFNLLLGSDNSEGHESLEGQEERLSFQGKRKARIERNVREARCCPRSPPLRPPQHRKGSCRPGSRSARCPP